MVIICALLVICLNPSFQLSVYIDERLICELLRNSPDLVELECFCMNARLLTALQEHSPKLLRVFCGSAADVTNSMLISFCKSFPSLKRLLLCGAKKLTDAAVDAIVEYCPELELISLRGWELLTDKALVALAKLNCLQNFSFDGNLSYTNSSIANIVRNNPGIRNFSITLSDKARFDSRVFRYMAGYCDNFKYIDIDVSPSAEAAPHKGTSGPTSAPSSTSFLPTDEDLVPLIRTCPILQTIDIDCASQLTERLLIALGSNCPRLTSVKLAGHSAATAPALITDEGIASLATGCPKLDTLDVGACMELTDQGILSLAEHCKRLSSFSLEGNDKITDVGMRALFESCTELTTFEATKLSNLTDEGMLALPLHCHKLSELRLHTMGVTDAFLQALANGCPKLTKLKLHGYTFKSNAYNILMNLLEHCPLLTDLNLTACSGVTNHTHNNLVTNHAKQLKRLKIWDCLDLRPDQQMIEMKKSPPPGLHYEVGMSEGGLMSMLMSIMQQPDEEVKEEEEDDEEDD